MSLKSRITLTLLAILAVTLGGVAVGTYQLVERSLIDRIDDRIGPIAGGSPAELAQLGPAFQASRTIFDNGVRVNGFAADGRRLLVLPLQSRRTLPVTSDEVRRVLAGSSAAYSTTVDGQHLRVLVSTLQSPAGGTIGLSQPDVPPELRAYVRKNIEAQQRLLREVAVVAVGVPLDDVDQTLSRLLRVELALIVPALLAALVAGWLIVRREMRPLDRVAETASAIAAGDLSQRVAHAGPRTEVGKLGRALNAMLHQIETSFVAQATSEQRLRRFVADASHELRTPLTSIRGFAELFRRGAAARPEDLARAMASIESEASRMSALVDDLLVLARLDEQRPQQSDRVGLSEVIGAAVAAARAVEPDRHIAAEIAPEVTVTGDPARLRQAVDNLLANVRSHTPARTPCEVTLRRDGATAVLIVADSGPGMSAEAAQRAFERFYRADASRSRDAGGSGLGLAIVAAIAESHGGTVALDSDETGTVVRLCLPIDPSGESQPADGGAPST